VMFKEITTGAANDFDQATSIARAMVVEYGMSTLGPVNYGPTRDITEWGKSYWEQNSVSQEMMAKIDQEIKTIVTAGYELAVSTIDKQKKLLDKVATALLDKESLDQDEFEKIVGVKSRQDLLSLNHNP